MCGEHGFDAYGCDVCRELVVKHEISRTLAVTKYMVDTTANSMHALADTATSLYTILGPGGDRTQVYNENHFRGLEDLESVLNSDNARLHKQCLRMSKDLFLKLVEEIKDVYKPDGRAQVGAHELMYMYITFAGQKLTQVYLARIFGRSSETVFNGLRKMIKYINLIVYPKYVLMPTTDTSIPHTIRNNTKFYPFFNCVLGAQDGTHLPIMCREADHARYRNRKGFLSQNVFACVGFDRNYQYILCGSEGCAHDGAVYDKVQRSPGWEVPKGKCMLADMAYPLTWHCLVPYKGTRYHLNDFGKGADRPRNYKELFNLRHSSLRNAAECGFGIDKRRFPALKYACELNMYDGTQASFFYSVLAVSNFIRTNDPDNDAEWGPDDEGIDDTDTRDRFEDYEVTLRCTQRGGSSSRDSGNPLDPTSTKWVYAGKILPNMGTPTDDGQDTPASKRHVSHWRDSIAMNMWDEYIKYRTQHDILSDTSDSGNSSDESEPGTM